jgi:integral membrane protein (TIGR01906 family)
MVAELGRVSPVGAVLVVLVALAVVVVIIVNAFRLTATETFVRYEYGHAELPVDSGLSLSQRRALALTGLSAIRPHTAGIRSLEEATLPDGSPAFGRRELTHMGDVRRLFGRALWLQIALGIGLGGAALGLSRTKYRSVVPRGLLVGALGTLAVALVAIPAILLGFDGFFASFHGVFFEGDSWRFVRGDTLLRIYPKRFWMDTSRVIAAVVILQALLLVPLAMLWHRRVAGAT